MSTEFTIIGLGQIGTSIGLALANQKPPIHRTGNDLEPEFSRKAQKMGAIDQVVFNIPNSVKAADVVILACPVDDLRENLKAIADDLRPGAVVINTAPIRVAVDAWAKEILPADRHFISITPTLNAAYLEDTTTTGPDSAHADLFKDALMVITTPPGTHPDALRLATDLTGLLGAKPYFADPIEADGLLAASQTLPELVAAALVNATIDEPGWIEGRKLAGQAYTAVTGPLLRIDESKIFGTTALLNRDNVLRAIDNLIRALYNLRTLIEEKDSEALQKLIFHAMDGRARWWAERKSSDWDRSQGPSVPSGGQMLGRLIGFGPKDKAKK
jgi:prephenate dehydrogenase